MAKKKLKSGLTLDGISPNILLSQVENTAPFLFKNGVDLTKPKREYLQKLVFYKKNLKQLNNLNLPEYFHLCLSAHWATAGTYVPTDVDNQIREKLWKHSSILKHIDKMVEMTIDSWSWDYTPMTDRKSYTKDNKVISTHEGTWLSVAIGAYCASMTHKREDLALRVKEVILKEIKKEEALLQELKKNQEHINFIKATPLVAHNFGDLDRVMVAWDMHEKDEFCKSIYKLGHIPNKEYDSIIVYGGRVNKVFTAKENHRHLSLRKSKALRKSNKFLVPVTPFTYEWANRIGTSDEITAEEKAEIITCLFEGCKREAEATGYAIAISEILNCLGGISALEQYLPFDFIKELKDSSYLKEVPESQEWYYKNLEIKLNNLICDVTSLKFN